MQLEEKERAVFEVMSAKMRADSACKIALEKSRLGVQGNKLLVEENTKKVNKKCADQNAHTTHAKCC